MPARTRGLTVTIDGDTTGLTKALAKAVVVAWNSLVGQRADKLAEWKRLTATGNALERYRSRLLIAVTADGPIRSEIPELTRMFLEESWSRDLPI